jgi:hypothetical protein
MGLGQEIVLLAAFFGGFIGLNEGVTPCDDPRFIRRNGYPGIQGGGPQKFKSLTFDRLLHGSTDVYTYYKMPAVRC